MRNNRSMPAFRKILHLHFNIQWRNKSNIDSFSDCNFLFFNNNGICNEIRQKEIMARMEKFREAVQFLNRILFRVIDVQAILVQDYPIFCYSLGTFSWKGTAAWPNPVQISAPKAPKGISIRSRGPSLGNRPPENSRRLTFASGTRRLGLSFAPSFGQFPPR